MKKLLLSLLLVFASTTSNANQAEMTAMCADLAIRYTVFAMLAKDFDTRAEYEAEAYKSLAKSNATQETREILQKIIELAWLTRNDDVTKSANFIYQTCAKDDSI